MESILDIAALKRRAKELKRSTNLNHTQALDAVAHYHRYDNWAHLMRVQNQLRSADQDAPPQRDDAYLSPYENPSYVRNIFR